MDEVPNIENVQMVDANYQEIEARVIGICDTRSRLAESLKRDNMPHWMILNAETGVYDFDGRKQLLKDLLKKNNTEMMTRVANGEFNHTKPEVEALLRRRGWKG